MIDKIDLSQFVVPENEKKPIELSQVVNTLDEQLSIRVSSKTKKDLETMAKKYKLTISEVIRQLTEQGIELVNR